MTDGPSDALVFFGATGDLAYKKIFPALQAMAAPLKALQETFGFDPEHVAATVREMLGKL